MSTGHITGACSGRRARTCGVASSPRAPAAAEAWRSANEAMGYQTVASLRNMMFASCAILLTCLSPGCTMFSCENEVIERVVSPDGSLEAIIFDRECGATTSSTTQVSVHIAGATLPDEGGNVFVAATDQSHGPLGPWGGPKVSVRWIDTDTLQISYDPRTHVSSRNESLHVKGSGRVVQTLFGSG
jgi:hypothetical protein